MTSPVCPVYVVTCWPVSISHKALKHNLIQINFPICRNMAALLLHDCLHLCIYLPGHIATACNNLVIIEEPTATEVASVSRKFPADPNIAFASFQATYKKENDWIWSNIIIGPHVLDTNSHYILHFNYL